MDFTLTDEQRMFQKMFADFAEKEVKPIGEHTDQQEEPPLEVLQKAAMQGFLGALFPEEQGGVGLDFVSYVMLLEELAKADVTTAMTISVHNGLAGKTILDFGSAEQHEKYLEPMAFGEMIGAFALTEPAAGSDAAALESTAVRDGGEYVLNGNKIWVSNGGIAGLFVVFAKTDPSAGARGISAFIVEKDTPGLKVGRREKTLGLRLPASRRRGHSFLYGAHSVWRAYCPQAGHPELRRRFCGGDRGLALAGLPHRLAGRPGRALQP